MCGFAGFVDPSLPGDRPPGEVARRMAGTLDRRGPDDEGFWSEPSRGLFLGFRRLAILDLSESGHQPMISASGRFVLVFNGEVYNFRELARELARDHGATFRGGSDTEVLLAAFEAWGPRASVERFHGMFAFAVYDREEKELWLARDRMGIKPLFYAGGDGWLAFGSELRALLPHPRVSRTGNAAAAWHYLRTLYVPAPLSILEDVHKLLPGTLVRFTVEEGGVRERERVAYWSLESVARAGHRAPDPSSRGEVLDRLEELLTDAVRERLIADVPVGALLSGGVDSSLVVALMARQAGQVRTFTVGFEDPRFDETPVAEAVAAHLGTEHTSVAMPTSAVQDLVPEMGDFMDEPLANPAILPTLLVCEVARRDVVVALSGDGGDELFGGYNRYRQFPRIARKAGWIPGPVRPALGGALAAAASVPGTDRVGRLLARRFGEQHSFAARLRRVASIVGARDPREAYLEFMAVGHPDPPMAAVAGRTEGPDYGPFDRHPGSLLGKVTLLDQLQYLPDDLLAKVDRASMWVSLEARVPVLDHRVVEFSWTLPDRCKIHGDQMKRPLRALAERYLPAEILDRPKMGFTVPLDPWLRGGLAEWLGDRLAPGTLEARGLWDQDEVDRLHGSFRSGGAGLALPLWTVAVLEDWCQRRGVTFR